MIFFRFFFVSDLNAEFKLLFDELRLDQAEVAKRLRLSRPSIGRYLNGQMKPKHTTVESLRRLVEIENLSRRGEPVAPSIVLREEEVPYVTMLRAMPPDKKRLARELMQNLCGVTPPVLSKAERQADQIIADTYRPSSPTTAEVPPEIHRVVKAVAARAASRLQKSSARAHAAQTPAPKSTSL